MTMVMGTRLNITLALMLSVLLGSRISVVFFKPWFIIQDALLAT